MLGIAIVVVAVIVTPVVLACIFHLMLRSSLNTREYANETKVGRLVR
ncbi:MAG: hypothetical protein FWC66_10290 [Oscillospiraceae bacterium]|jgi:hypothetical protein|nr:hypothetical protein [Oscillospiraceae bacterium]